MAGVQLAPGPDGFDVAGTGLEIGFGRSEAGAIAAAGKVLGRTDPKLGATPGGCRVWRWPGGVAMIIRDGRFVGWLDPALGAGGDTCGAVA